MSSGASTSRSSGTGRAVLEPRTVETMTAAHRWGLRDATFGNVIPWGSACRSTSPAAPDGGRSATAAWRRRGGLADPELGLVLVVVANGLAGYFEAEQRNADATDAVVPRVGETSARLRRPNSGPRRGGTLST